MTGSSQRLHPLSILFLTLGTLRGFILPAGLVILTARGSSWDVWALWLSIPMALVSVFRYFTTRYAFADDELVIQTGLLFRNERHIRYSRIQNIETVQNPLHRAFRVADVRVETGGGTEQEARMQVLSLAAVDEMRHRVFEGKRRAANATGAAAPEADVGAEAPATAAPEHVLVRMGLGDIVLFGLVQNRGGLVVAAVLGLLWEINALDSDFGSSAKIRHLARQAEDAGWFNNWDVAVAVVVAGLIVTFLVVVRLLSIGWAIVRLYDFTLVRSGDELRTSCGLFTKVRAVIPLRRIQLVSMRQAPLQRAFDRVELRVQTAGGDKEASVSREWLAPMLRRDAVDTLLAEVVPGPGFDAMEWRPVDARAGYREFRASLRVIAAAAFVAMWLVPLPALLFAFPLAALAYLASRKRARAFGFALAEDRVGYRGGWLWRSASLARYAKVQAVQMSESPFDRRWQMANVSADTAGGGSHRISIPYLSTTQAKSVFDELGARANETAFRW